MPRLVEAELLKMSKEAVARHYELHEAFPRHVVVSEEIWHEFALPGKVLAERLRVDSRLRGLSCYTRLGE